MIAKAPLVGRGTGVPFIGPSPRCRPSGTVISPQRRTPSAATLWYQVWSKSELWRIVVLTKIADKIWQPRAQDSTAGQLGRVGRDVCRRELLRLHDRSAVAPEEGPGQRPCSLIFSKKYYFERVFSDVFAGLVRISRIFSNSLDYYDLTHQRAYNF